MDTMTLFGSRLALILLESGALLLVGAFASGLIDAFLSPEDVVRRLPRRALPAALTGTLLGLLIPAGGLGSIAAARRLMSKGAVPALGAAYLAGGPVLNLMTLAGLAASLGGDHAALVAIVIAITGVLALLTGLVFALYPVPVEGAVSVCTDRLPPGPGLRHALTIAVRESLEIGRWLVIGALLAAAVSLWLTPDALDTRLDGPAESVGAGLALGLGRGTGPLTNAFTAPDMMTSFGAGATASFLVLGAAATLTRLVALVAVFRCRVALALVALAALVAALAGLWIALNTTI